MDYRMESIGTIQLLGKAERQFTDKVQADLFWKTCKHDGTLETLTRYSTSLDKEYIGIADASSYDGKSYLYYIATPYEGKKLPEGFMTLNLPAALWIKFRYAGAETENTTDKDIWTRIYSEFFPVSAYEPSGYQLEVYPYGDGSYPDSLAEIWISARTKS